MASVVGPVSAALKAVTGLIQSGAGAVSSALGLIAAPLLAVSSTAGALQPLVGGDKVSEVAFTTSAVLGADAPVLGDLVDAHVAASEAPSVPSSEISGAAPEALVAPEPAAQTPEAAVNFEQFLGGMRKMKSRRNKRLRVSSNKRRSSSLKRNNKNKNKRGSRSRSRVRYTK